MKQTYLNGLYAITDNGLMPDDDTLISKVRAALEGGVKLVQYRDKTDDTEKRLRQAKALTALCNEFGAALLINDDMQLAKDSGAHGVHLGQSDGSHQRARELLGADAIIGATCHDSLELAQAARDAGVDYVAFGAFFKSSTKPHAKPAPLSLLPEAKAALNLPVVAIGGVSVDNADQVIEAGADMVAVVHALFGADDISARAQAFNTKFN